MSLPYRERERCRLCYTYLALRERSSIFASSTSASSFCSKSSFHLFQPIQRRKFPQDRLTFPSSPTATHRTVSLAHLIRRYLRTEIASDGLCSTSICAQCSVTLLDIEQCAKYLRKSIAKLKVKLNKSNQLFHSSLAAKYQKKSSIEHRRNELEATDLNEEDQDQDQDDDDDDEEESDDEQGRVKSSKSAANISRNSTKTTSSPCNGDDDDDEVDDEDDDEDDDDEDEGEEEEGDGTATSKNSFDPTTQSIEENNPAMLQLRMVQMMANFAAAAAAATTGSNPNPINNEAMIATFANMQRNMMMKFINDPMAAAAHAAMINSQIKANLSPVTSILSNSSQSTRKRKSTPEKRVITNNGHISPHDEQEAKSFVDHPLELTRKTPQTSNDVHRTNTNGSSTSSNHHRFAFDEVGKQNPIDSCLDAKESPTSNDQSDSRSSSLARQSNNSKRQRPSSAIPTDFSHSSNMDLASSAPTANFDEQNSLTQQQRQQQKKLDPRTCAECGIVIFNDKTHLLHGQTHAKNEKQCWICGFIDDDVKKHILAEHGNQKFTAAGFKCQHCERAFPVYADLENHLKEHSKKKPFECSICHKRFGQQGNLSCHLRIHSGVKPFNCNSCGKAFRHSNSLRRHARTVHSANRGLTGSANSLVLPDHNLSLNSSIKDETYDDEPSGLMIPSDDGSSSTGGVPSPSLSNAPNDTD